MAWVPGSFELPLVAKQMAKSGKFDAVITVGAVVGQLCYHHDANLSLVTKRILTCRDMPFMEAAQLVQKDRETHDPQAA